MLPFIGCDQSAAQPGGRATLQVLPSSDFCSRSRDPAVVDTVLTRHRATVVLPPSNDVGSVQLATPVTDDATVVATPLRGSIVSGAPAASWMSTRTGGRLAVPRDVVG